MCYIVTSGTSEITRAVGFVGVRAFRKHAKEHLDKWFDQDAVDWYAGSELAGLEPDEFKNFSVANLLAGPIETLIETMLTFGMAYRNYEPFRYDPDIWLSVVVVPGCNVVAYSELGVGAGVGPGFVEGIHYGPWRGLDATAHVVQKRWRSIKRRRAETAAEYAPGGPGYLRTREHFGSGYRW